MRQRHADEPFVLDSIESMYGRDAVERTGILPAHAPEQLLIFTHDAWPTMYGTAMAALYDDPIGSTLERQVVPDAYEPSAEHPSAEKFVSRFGGRLAHTALTRFESLGLLELPQDIGEPFLDGPDGYTIFIRKGGSHHCVRFWDPNRTPEVKRMVGMARWWIHAAEWRIRLHLRLERSGRSKRSS